MATIPVGFSEATLIWQAIGSTRQATWSIGVNDTLNPAEDPTVLAESIYTAALLTNSITPAARMSTEWTFQGVRATTMQEVGPLSADYIVPVTGTATNLTPVMNSAVLVRKITASGGRRNRGRLYHPPILVNEATTGTTGILAPSAVANQQLGFDTFFDAVEAMEWSMRLFHQSPPYTPTPITGFAVQAVLATQRRRLRK